MRICPPPPATLEPDTSVKVKPPDGRPAGYPAGGWRPLALFQAHVAGRVHPHGQEPGDHDRHPGDPEDVPEAGDQADEGARLPDHLGDGDDDGVRRATAEGLSWTSPGSWRDHCG